MSGLIETNVRCSDVKARGEHYTPSGLQKREEHGWVVSLDFDDTLVASEREKRAALLEVCGARGAAGVAALEGVETDARAAGARVTRHTIFAAVAKKLVADGLVADAAAEAKELVAAYSAAVDARLEDAPEIEGATRLLEYLRSEGVEVYVNSATPHADLARAVAQRGWTMLVEAALGLPEAGGDKADTLREIATLTGAEPAKMIHVGDGANDADAAARFGCAFVRIDEAVPDMVAAAAVICETIGLAPPPPCPTCERLRTAAPIWRDGRWILLRQKRDIGDPPWKRTCVVATARHAPFGQLSTAEDRDYRLVVRHVDRALKALGASGVTQAAPAAASVHWHATLRAEGVEGAFDFDALERRLASDAPLATPWKAPDPAVDYIHKWTSSGDPWPDEFCPESYPDDYTGPAPADLKRAPNMVMVDDAAARPPPEWYDPADKRPPPAERAPTPPEWGPDPADDRAPTPDPAGASSSSSS